MVASGGFVSTALAASLVLLVSGCGGSNGAATAGRPSASLVHPTVVELTCDASGTSATTSTAVVDRDGLHLKLTVGSGQNGALLNYRYPAADGASPGGGDLVPVGTSEHLLQVPPGDVLLDCSDSQGSKTTAPVKVRADDPNGYYRSVTLAALGCSSTATPSWAVGPTRGRTAEEALGALLLASGLRPGLHARLAPIGYVGSASRTYILERGGTPWATAVVSSEGAEYVAGLDILC